MELKKLSDDQVEKQLQYLVTVDRNTLHDVLVHISEINARKIYLRRARTSLFDYLIKDCKFSSPAAQRRLDASRLSDEIPGILPKIQTGILNLSHVSILQKGIRQKDKIEKVGLDLKLKILTALENSSYVDAEKIVARELGLQKINKTVFTAQSDESMRLSLTLSKEAWEKLGRCRELLGHKIPGGELPEVVAFVLDHYLKKEDPNLRTVTSGPEVTVQQNPTGPLPKKLRAQILQRDQSCRFVDPQTNRTCESKLRLQVDHIKMRVHGGTNDPKNLQALCAAHNRQAARDNLGQ